MLTPAHVRLLPRDERGSLIVGMGVLMVIGILSIGLTARSLGSLGNVRHTQDYRAALSVADGGVSDAKFRIEAGEAGTFTSTGTFGEGQFTYTATKVSASEWTVRSDGVVNGVGHAVEVTITQDAEYPYAIFTEQDLILNGNGGFNIASYNSLTGETDTGNAVVGSDHAIVINGGGGGDAQHYYTPAGSCTGCANGEQKVGPKTYDDPTAPTSSQSCPVSGQFGPVIDGQNGLAFLCNQNVSFASGAVSVVNPPAIIYIAANYTLSITSSQINDGGSAADIIIRKAGNGTFTVGPGALAGVFNGVLFAPSTDAVVAGGMMNLDGSLTLNSLTVNGDPNFELLYDDSILDIKSGDWVVQDWHEVPSDL